MSNLEPKIPGISLNYVVPTPEPELLTGVPVFLGLTLSPEEGEEPKKLSLVSHFQQYFGQAEGYLADAIAGFFANGGRLCYVIALSDNTLASLQQGLEASEVLENVDLVCVPDIMLGAEAQIIEMQQAILKHCEQKGDRFAILDAWNIADVEKLNQQRRELASHNGALYAPWLQVESRDDYIPPCGHIAGIYASSDRTIGVHSAPANIPLDGVLNLSFSLTFTEQAQLNPQTAGGINCIRSFPGRGMRVWGVRTLSPITEWQYINVRRLFLTFGRWVNRNLADTVFEPNAFPLWVRLQRELSVYCESLWREGALQGTTPDEAFYVKCNAQTNPPENRERGQVVAEVGLAPTIPGEFIQLLVVQSSSGITLK
ncbi:phage tail sheath subtilisin-like domain-containing protein [Nostoc sp. TCL26-01]|uniref:phage tail sheath family protein n=1 Tax=Nostoc sp. TCL26-01 TaxID=2576904 RepID=UPI0015BBB784|nr:phage tail sheath subtilisin-like domain-containing protein [Nostoc sp. TCL26-01]QLE58018.1 phage tail sheath family protein [Nostoc sp. TCL26-01]